MPAGWVAAAATVYSAYTSDQNAKKARQAASEAAGRQESAQNRALDYQMEREKLPTQFREGALTKLAGAYGLEGGEGSQQDLIDQAMESPLYTRMLERGEESVLRNSAATGGLRSGNVQDNLARSSQDALLTSYNQQISGLNRMSGLPDNTNSIANTMTGIGTTQAQGIIAQQQIAQQNSQNNMNLVNNAANSYMQYKYSDIRAKDNIIFIGMKNGYKYYSWTWNKLGEKLGLTGPDTGVMAHEIHKIKPDAVTAKDGVLLVNYAALEA